MSARRGAQALALNAGVIAVGKRADLVVIDMNHLSLAGRKGDQALDSYVFVAGKSAVRDVMVAGAWVVRGGRHGAECAARSDYVAVVTRMLQS